MEEGWNDDSVDNFLFAKDFFLESRGLKEHLRECGQGISDGCALLLPCASLL